MNPLEGGAFLDPTNWANVYSHGHSGLIPATQYCYRFRYRNGDGLPGGAGDITPFTPWSCALTTSTCSLGPLLCGDCDGNQFNNIADSLRIAQIAAGLFSMPAYGTNQFNACNVYGAIVPDPGADVGILDSLWNARHLVGLVPLTCCVP